MNFGSRSNVEMFAAYPHEKATWQNRLLEVSFVMEPEWWQWLKVKDHVGGGTRASGTNLGIGHFLQLETKLGFPHYPYIVEEQEVKHLSGFYDANMTSEASNRSGAASGV